MVQVVEDGQDPLPAVARSWVRLRLGDIFPSNPEEAYLRDAVWDTYIIFCQPDDVVFALLHDEYRAAVNRLDATAPPPDGLHENAHARLGQHLVLLVLRGTLDVKDELVRTYFDRASPADRHAALTYVGRLLIGADDITPDVIARAQQLWEVRRAATTANRDAGELAAFGWWFNSAKLPDAWSMAQLVLSGSVSVAPTRSGAGPRPRPLSSPRTYPLEQQPPSRWLRASPTGTSQSWQDRNGRFCRPRETTHMKCPPTKRPKPATRTQQPPTAPAEALSCRRSNVWGEARHAPQNEGLVNLRRATDRWWGALGSSAGSKWGADRRAERS